VLLLLLLLLLLALGPSLAPCVCERCYPALLNGRGMDALLLLLLLLLKKKKKKMMMMMVMPMPMMPMRKGRASRERFVGTGRRRWAPSAMDGWSRRGCEL